MNVIVLIIAALLASAMSAFSVTIPIKNSNSVELLLNFAFDNILIGERDLACNDNTDCRYVDQNYQNGDYHGEAYAYKHVVISIKIRGESYDLPIHLNSKGLNVFGVSRSAPYFDALVGKKDLAINMRTGEISVSTNGDTNFPLDFNDAKKFYYSSVKLEYGLEPFKVTNKITNTARLCFQNGLPVSSANYFFLAEENFLSNWDNFLSNAVSLIGTEIGPQKVIFPGSDLNYVTYDENLFKSYDRYPLKQLDFKDDDFCDIFAGDYFVQRAGLYLVLGKDVTAPTPRVGMLINEEPYEVYFRINFRLILSVIVSLSFWSMLILLCCGPLFGVKRASPAQDK